MEHFVRQWLDARNSLIQKIDGYAAPTDDLARVEVEAPPASLLNWLNMQGGQPRYYWRDRSGSFEMAGVGEADVALPETRNASYEIVSSLRDRISRAAGALRYYGGFRFHPVGDEEGRWHDFKGFRFVVPLVEYVRTGDQYRLACNLKPGMDLATVLERVRALQAGMAGQEQALPAFRSRTDLPDQAGWRALVQNALSEMEGSPLEKVVLARQSTFLATGDIDPVLLMSRLAEQAPNVYLYCFQPAEKRAFLGASPERLYARDGASITSEALAGTRPRGDAPSLDAELARALLSCDKERREHVIVIEWIHDVLERLCSRVQAAPHPDVMKLAHCQHLHTPIEGALLPGVQDAQLLEALHPTPAVGGRPRARAMRWILAQEPFERGIYAAPVGWISRDAAEFCVGIRSGLVRGCALTLYAGAGIVSGSQPDAEWEEINAKMAAFLKVIMKGA